MMSQELANMWIQMKRHFEVRATEWYSAAVLSAWGYYTILHPGLYEGAGKTLYHAMLDMAPQEVWGLTAIIVGQFRLCALFINGRWGVTPTIRIITSFVSILVWFCVSAGLYRSGLSNYGVLTYPALLLADVHSCYRAAIDAYEARVMKHLQKKATATGESNVRIFQRG